MGEQLESGIMFSTCFDSLGFEELSKDKDLFILESSLDDIRKHFSR